MALAPGTRLGPYEVAAQIGAGGMGEVYRAADTNLKRQVALKVLPAAVATDPDRLARFQREAEVLAALNHPNIAHIHGLEKADCTFALVMELVDGPTLADRLAQGPLPLDEVLRIARQVTDALEAAHERGIVHRDLKPANIKLRPDGTVKVLDFGLATASAATYPPGADIADSPTLTARATRAGMILGTAAYMAPEQAKGRAVDRRADIWAFGVVLYEMLTGVRAFAGDDVSDVLASVLKDTPSMTALPAPTPASVRRLLRRCLEKDTARRLASIGDARLEIDDAAAEEQLTPSAPRATFVLPWALGALVTGAAVAWALAPLVSRAPAAEAPIALAELPPPGTQLTTAPVPSPDGRWLAILAEDAAGNKRLWTREISDPARRAIDNSEGVTMAFWSPDSAQLAFVAHGQVLRVASESTAPSLVVAAEPAGAAWLPDGDLLLSIKGRGLMRVQSAGGTLRPVEGFASEAFKKLNITDLSVSPDGRSLLFNQFGGETGGYVSRLDGSGKKLLFPGEQSPAVFVGPDVIVRQDANMLVAHRFSAADLSVGAESFPIAQNIGNDQFAGSATGTLSYIVGAWQRDRLTWLARDGKATGTIGRPGLYTEVAISRNGRWLAFVRRDANDGNVDIWLQPLAGGAPTRFTSDPDVDHLLSISPDEREIAWEAHAKGALTLMRRPADGSAPPQLVRPWGRAGGPTDWTPDGRSVLYQSEEANVGSLWIVPMDRPGAATRLTPEGIDVVNGQFSPDGTWLAFSARPTGQLEVYLQRFDGRTLVAGAIRISEGGGDLPLWRRDSRELYFVTGDTIMAVDIGSGDRPAGTPHALFTKAGLFHIYERSYAVTPDGQRFLAIIAETGQAPHPATVVLNWHSALTARGKR